VPEKWNSPSINRWRYFITLFSLFVLGANDASIRVCAPIQTPNMKHIVYTRGDGLKALIPYLEEYYNISYTVIATMFLSQVIGYTISAVIINKMHMSFGQFRIAALQHMQDHCLHRHLCPPSFSRHSRNLRSRRIRQRPRRRRMEFLSGSLETPNELLGSVSISIFPCTHPLSHPL
jgi:hypothetical protein